MYKSGEQAVRCANCGHRYPVEEMVPLDRFRWLCEDCSEGFDDPEDEADDPEGADDAALDLGVRLRDGLD